MISLGQYTRSFQTDDTSVSKSSKLHLDPTIRTPWDAVCVNEGMLVDKFG